MSDLVMGVDLGISTGCVGVDLEDGSIVSAYAIDCGPPGDGWEGSIVTPSRVQRLARELDTVIDLWDPCAVAYEDVRGASRGRSTAWISAATGILMTVPGARLVMGTSPAQLKQFATGDGRAEKPAMIDALVGRDPVGVDRVLWPVARRAAAERKASDRPPTERQVLTVLSDLADAAWCAIWLAGELQLAR